MSLTVNGSSATSIEPIEEGTHLGVCNMLIDLGMQYNETYKNSSRKVLVGWEIPDETIELEDGRHGIVLTPEELPPTHMMVDIGLRNGKPRISMGDREISPEEIGRRVKERMRKVGEFPVMIRADFAVPHYAVARVMNACTANGIWKISFMAVYERKAKD